MKILVLGQSGSSGDRNDGVSWTTVFRDRLEIATGQSIELEHTMFYPAGGRAPDIAQKRVADAEPDLVLIPVGAWAFSAKFVWLRVERWFGKRAGRWFLGAEEAVTRATYERGRLRQATNQVLRWTAGKVIGGEPYSTRGQVTEIYAEILRMIAREEDIDVVVVPGSNLGNLMHSGAVAPQRRRYMDDIQSFVAEHHFQWIDPTPALGDFQGEMAGMEPDDLHSTVDVQRAVGEFVAAAYMENAKARAEAG